VKCDRCDTGPVAVEIVITTHRPTSRYRSAGLNLDSFRIATIRGVFEGWLKPKSECNLSGRLNPMSQIRRQVMRWLKTPSNPARRITCDSADHREAKSYGKELRHRWLRLAKR